MTRDHCIRINPTAAVTTSFFSNGTTNGSINICATRLDNSYNFIKKAPQNDNP